MVSLEEGVAVDSTRRNARIEPGDSVTVRFRATGVPQRPTRIVLRGEDCAFG